MNKKASGQKLHRGAGQFGRLPVEGLQPDLIDEKILPRMELFVALLAALVSLAMHFQFMLHAGGLWRDEVSAFNLAAMPKLWDVWHYLYYDSFPIVWVMALRVWNGLGMGSDVGLRIFGFLSGLSILGALWYSARCCKIKSPLFSLLLIGLSPVMIVFGDSMRAWGWGAFWILLCFGFIWRVVENPSRRNVVLAVATAVIGVQTTYYNSVLLFAICTGGAVVALRHRMWKRSVLVLAIGATAAISLLPYLGVFRIGSAERSATQVQYGLDNFIARLSGALSGSGIFSESVVAIGIWWVLILASLVIIVLCQFSPARLKATPAQRDLVLFCATVMAVGTASYFVFLHQMHFFTQSWYYITLMVVGALAMDGILSLLDNQPLGRLSRLVGFGMMLGIVFLPVSKVVKARMSNVDLIAQKLNTLADKNDLVLVSPWYCGITFDRYYSGAAAWTSVPDIKDHKLCRYDSEKELISNPDQEELLGQVLNRVNATLKSGHRVWIVSDIDFRRRHQSLGWFQAPPQAGVSLPPDVANNMYWAETTAHFIENHASQLKLVNIEMKEPLNQFESLQLVEASGSRPNEEQYSARMNQGEMSMLFR